MKKEKLILSAPEAYKNLTKEEKKEICNGCGAKGGFNVPNTMWGLNIGQACDIHDLDYKLGKTIEDKEKADRRFLNNCFRIIDFETTGFFCYFLKKLRLMRAKEYYLVVKYFGADAFWAGKNKNEEVIV